MPDAGALLRDKTHITRLLILREFHARERRTLREVAGALGVTVQAVSTYVRGLVADGLVAEKESGYAPTPRGVQHLQEGFGRIRRAVDEALSPLTVIEVTSAVAGDAVPAGTRVGLFMEDGELVARLDTSSSQGRALVDAKPGEEVLVGDLEGVVDLKPGRLVIFQLPAPIEGGSHRVPPERLGAALAEHDLGDARIGAHGTGAKVAIRTAGLHADFEFASVESAFNAAERGLDVALFVSRDLLTDAVALLDDRNARTLARVPVEIADVPLAGEAPELHASPPPPAPARRRRRRG